MTPFDAIAQPFIERDFDAPYYDYAIEASRRRHEEERRRKRKEEQDEVLQDHR